MRSDLPLTRSALVLTAALACGSDPAADDDASSTGTATQGSDTTGSTTASGSDDTSADDTSSSTTDGPGECATVLGSGPEPIFDAPAGRFAFREYNDYRTLVGFIGDGPRVDFHHEAERNGACRLLSYTPSSCTPECAPPAVCIDEACVSPPSGLSAGDVSLHGVGAETIAITEDPFHNYFWDREGGEPASMPTLTATGADVDGFELSVCPSSPPTPEGDWSALLEARAPGESVLLTWSDPIDTARIYLRMTTGIATHGGISPIEIECEGPDVGELELPGDYLDALYADGWACGECGGNDLVRYHADQTTDAGVQFRAEAVTNFWFIP